MKSTAAPWALALAGVAAAAAAAGCAATSPGEEDAATDVAAAAAPAPAAPALHHVHLNSTDPEAAVAWYLALWPAATRATVDGRPAVAADMLLLFDEVGRPPPGAWDPALHRTDPQSAFWHIGAFTNTTFVKDRLAALGVGMLPLFVGPDDPGGVWRSGLTPYPGIRTAGELEDPPRGPAVETPRPGGFSYVVGPDGALVELTGGPRTEDSFSHVHFFHEHPRCAEDWYVEHLGMGRPPGREVGGEGGVGTCEEPRGERGWPSLEPAGTVRSPRGGVVFDGGSMSWYPPQCDPCGARPFAPSRGQVLDHVAFAVDDVEAWHARLRDRGVRILEPPYSFAGAWAFMIEDPDGLAVELVERGAGGR